MLLTGSSDGTARLWDATTAQPLGPPLRHTAWISAVAFSPDGKSVLTGGKDKTARLWDITTGQPLGIPLKHSGTVTEAAFSPDGKIALTGSSDGTARLWDATTGQSRCPPLLHLSQVSAVAFSPDGKTVLTGSADKTARLWDASTGRPLGPPLTHQNWVFAVAFSPDGKTVLTGTLDGTVQLWDATTAQPLGPPMRHTGWISTVAFSRDGKTVVIQCHVEAARLWDVSELPDNPEQVATWVEVFTGLGLDELGSVMVLDNSSSRERCDHLETQGGKPTTAPRWSLEPILFGPEPTARAKAWIERNRWAKAEAAFAEAIDARPLSGAVRDERGRFFVSRSQPEKAASGYRAIVQLEPHNLQARVYEILSLLAADDHSGVRQARADLLDRFRETTDPWTANRVAWYLTLAPGAVADPETPVRLAELAVKGLPGGRRLFCPQHARRSPVSRRSFRRLDPPADGRNRGT